MDIILAVIDFVQSMFSTPDVYVAFDPLTLTVMAAASAGKAMYDRSKERQMKRGHNRQMDEAIKSQRQQQRMIDSQNRNAYGRALTFMAANRNNPNAWNTASSMYNNTMSGNAQRSAGVAENIGNYKANKQKVDSLGGFYKDMALQGGLSAASTVGSAMAFDYMGNKMRGLNPGGQAGGQPVGKWGLDAGRAATDTGTPGFMHTAGQKMSGAGQWLGNAWDVTRRYKFNIPDAIDKREYGF